MQIVEIRGDAPVCVAATGHVVARLVAEGAVASAAASVALMDWTGLPAPLLSALRPPGLPQLPSLPADAKVQAVVADAVDFVNVVCGEHHLSLVELDRALPAIYPIDTAAGWFAPLLEDGHPEKTLLHELTDSLRAAGYKTTHQERELLNGARLSMPSIPSLGTWMRALRERLPDAALLLVRPDDDPLGERRQLATDMIERAARIAGVRVRTFAAAGDGEGLAAEIGRVLEAVTAVPVTGPQSELRGRINAELFTAHETRLAELGEGGSGLYAHYATLLQRHDMLRAEDEAVLKLVLGELPPYDNYVVLQAGLGELPLAFAMAGHPAWAQDVHAARRLAIRASVTHFTNAGLIDHDAVKITDKYLPASAFTGSVLAIGLETALGQGAGEQVRTIQALASLDGLLIVPRLFLTMRESAEEQEAVLGQLEEAGMRVTERFPDKKLVYLTRAA